MNGNNNGYKSTREKTILDDSKLKLWADALPNGEGKPSLCWYWAGNNPRIDVYTNLPGDKDDGKIRAEIDITIANEIFRTIEEFCASDTKPLIMTWENSGKGWDRANNRPTKDMFVKSKIVVGKDKEGRMYIAILAADADRPKIKFHFGNNMFRKLYTENNEKASDQVVSRIAALAWIDTLRSLMPIIAANTYVYKTKGDQQGGGNRGGGGGGNNYNRGNGGGNRGGYNGGGGAGGDNNDLSDDLGF